MIVVDTTVLIYAVGAEHDLAGPCRELVAALGEGEVQATTTPEVLQEFVHVRSRRRGRADAVELARSLVALLSPLLVVEEADLDRGLALYESVEGLGPFDAVLAAAALRADATGLASADRAFGAVGGLRVLDPARGSLLP